MARAEALFTEGAGIVIGASKHLSSDESDTLRIEIMSYEAVDTSAIEGEQLDRDSVQSSIRRHLGLATDHRRAAPAEAGIAEMMVDLYQNVHKPLTEQTLHHWHRLIMNGRTDVKDLGQYRTHDDPMQIVSGPLSDPHVHFEAPPSHQVPQEMHQFLDGLHADHASRSGARSALTRAGMAHLWFESIHPYEDGNGRIGRAIIEKTLAQGLTTPVMTGMATTLLKHRKAYYAALERAHSELDITDWLLWFATKAIEAQRRTLSQVEFILNKSRFMQGLQGKLNPRQEKALLRLFAAGPDGFLGGLSAANYMRITDAPSATTTRDLSALVAMDALKRVGENKAARYYLNMPIQPVATVDLKDIL